MSTTFLILLLILCLILIIGLGLGFYFFQGKTEETMPTITVDDVSVESETPSGNTEMYTYDELSKDVKINITWSNGPDFDDVTNLYFTRTKGSVTDKKEADTRGRTSNSKGNKIVYIQKAGEDMRGQHTIKVTYKLRGQTQEKELTSFVANVSEDQLTLAKDSLKPVVVSYSPATVPFSSDVETQKTMVTLNPEPSGFGSLYFIPSGANNAIKIKRMSDGKFLKHDASFQASGDTFYVQSATGNRNRISTTDTDEGKLLTTVGPSLKKYTDMNPEERTKSLFTLTFSPATAPSPPTQESLMSKYISKNIYNNMKAQSSPSGVNAYKSNYYHEGVSSKYPGHVLFTVSSVPGSNWRSKETHCFNKCTDLGDDCRILTFKKDANNNILECSGHGINAYSSRDTATNRHGSYHKRTP